MTNTTRNIIFWILFILFLIMLFRVFQGPDDLKKQIDISYDKFIADVKNGKVKSVKIKEEEATGIYNDGTNFSTRLLKNDSHLSEVLLDNKVKTYVVSETRVPFLLQILINWFPIILIVGAWFFIIRQMQSGSNRTFGFGKSKARLLSEKSGRVTFDDVAGVTEAKQEVSEIVDFLKDPQKFQRLGGKIPKGVLLVGPPGTGKTLLGRAIAGEANVPFFSISGSEFVEMFVGVGASRVRNMFDQGKKNAPCIIFIDEIDAVGRHRGAGLGGGNDEREQTLNQLLAEMDGFETSEGVIILAATNRPDVLDPALLRPGRFDRQVVVPLPDVVGREAILKVHLKKIPASPDVDPKIIARGTPGFSGADLENIINESALLAARRNKRVVTMKELEEAKDKVMMGPERRSMVMDEKEKQLTAYHEGGHAIVSNYIPVSDPIHKATIIPRGRALGMVVRLPERDRISVTKEKLCADLAVAMGGRIAEEMIFGKEKITTGASNDIKHATEIARRMVTEWGMSEKLGPLTYGEPSQELFLGHSVTQHKNISEITASVIDKEVRKIIDESYSTATKILIKHKSKLDKLANALLEYESLTGEEITLILKGKKLNRQQEEKVKPIKRLSSVPVGKTTKKTTRNTKSTKKDKE